MPSMADMLAEKPRDNSDLPWVQRRFLDALGFAERLGAGGTPLRLYNDVVARGRRNPITEADFSPDELEKFAKLIAVERQRTGKPSGFVSPDTYDELLFKHGVDQSYDMIGGFQYETAPDGSAVIRDSYDFNLDRAGTGGIEGNGGVFQAITNPVGLAARIGRARVPDTSGGVPIQIKLQPGGQSLSDLLRQ
jgi:hypothetical protein